MARSSETAMERMLRLCREQGLPDVVLGTTFDSPALRVHDRPFASVKAEDCMVLHTPHDRKEFLLEIAPQIYWQTDHFKGWPGLMVRLDAIGDEELALRLKEAWIYKAPKRLAKASGLA